MCCIAMERHHELENLEVILREYGIPDENVEMCSTHIAQTYGAWRYLDGVADGAEAVTELSREACLVSP